MSSEQTTANEAADLEFYEVGPVTGFYPDGLTEETIDALIASVDAELAAVTVAADVRVTHSFTDVRRATRSERRSGRTVLRALPSLLDTAEAAPSEGEAA